MFKSVFEIQPQQVCDGRTDGRTDIRTDEQPDEQRQIYAGYNKTGHCDLDL